MATIGVIAGTADLTQPCPVFTPVSEPFIPVDFIAARSADFTIIAVDSMALQADFTAAASMPAALTASPYISQTCSEKPSHLA
jgi:hypothetical protein